MSTPLVLLHPLGADASFWGPMRAHLGAEVQVVTVDLPGHGRAPLPPADPSIDDWCARVLDTLDELGVEDFAVLGMSLGGLVAARLAATTQRVRALIVADAVDVYPPGMRLMWADRARIARREGTQELVDATLSLWFSPDFLADRGPVVRAATSMLQATSNEGYARACDLLANVDLRETVAVVACPSLVICGRRDGEAFVEAAPRLAAALPSARVAWLDGQHAVAAEQPAAFAHVVDEFLHSELLGATGGAR